MKHFQEASREENLKFKLLLAAFSCEDVLFVCVNSSLSWGKLLFFPFLIVPLRISFLRGDLCIGSLEDSRGEL